MHIKHYDNEYEEEDYGTRSRYRRQRQVGARMCSRSGSSRSADRFLRAPIDLRHEKDLVAVSVAQRLSHADFAGATIVVPNSCP